MRLFSSASCASFDANDWCWQGKEEYTKCHGGESAKGGTTLIADNKLGFGGGSRGYGRVRCKTCMKVCS